MAIVWNLSVLVLVLTTLAAVSNVQAAVAGVCGGIICNRDQDCPDGQACGPSPCGGKLCTRRSQEHPGTCPKLTPGSIGVCGGVFCTSDSGCQLNQKCCPSACGGLLCTNVFTRDPCAYFRCRNGGTCSAPADRPVCSCPAGYTGRRCETRVRPIIRDPCAYFRCRNGGTCSAPADRPVCLCRAGFTGRRCERRETPITRDPCAYFRCRNGGTCSAPADRPFCLCPAGFTGRRCERRETLTPISDGCGGCPPGQTCKLLQPVCAPGFACIQAFIPTCVSEEA